MQLTTWHLIEAGNAFPGVQCLDGMLHLLLQELAQGHADYMARVKQQGHQNFSQRHTTIRDELGMRAAEICAESWDRQREAPLDEIAREMFRSWRQSPGHWAVVCTPHDLYGAAMSRGANGIWYACILVGDET